MPIDTFFKTAGCPALSGYPMLAPANFRGVYLSVNSMCWAIGYFMGPPIGGWTLDQSQRVSNSFWLLAASSVGLVWGILIYLDRQLRVKRRSIGNRPR